MSPLSRLIIQMIPGVNGSTDLRRQRSSDEICSLLRVSLLFFFFSSSDRQIDPDKGKCPGDKFQVDDMSENISFVSS